MSVTEEALMVIGCPDTAVVRVNPDGFFKEAGHRDPLTEKLYRIFEQVVKTGEIGAPAFFCSPSPFSWHKEVGDSRGGSFLCGIDTGLVTTGVGCLSQMGIYQTDERCRQEAAAKEPEYAPRTPSPYFARFVLIKVPDTDHFSCFVYFERDEIHTSFNLVSLTELPPKVSKRVDRMLSQVLKLMGVPSGNSLQSAK